MGRSQPQARGARAPRAQETGLTRGRIASAPLEVRHPEIKSSVDTPRWWRARCAVALTAFFEERPLEHPKKTRKALRALYATLTQPFAPRHRRRIWLAEVRRRIGGKKQREIPDRRQLDLFDRAAA